MSCITQNRCYEFPPLRYHCRMLEIKALEKNAMLYLKVKLDAIRCWRNQNMAKLKTQILLDEKINFQIEGKK